MFLLNGKPLAPDSAFTHDGYQYPANWLRLSTPDEKAAIGITEAPDEPVYDQRFYWGVGIPKDLADLKTLWVATVKDTAGKLLTQTDWMVVREMDAGIAVPAEIKAERAAIRAASQTKEAALLAAESVEALAEFVMGQEFAVWVEAEKPAEEGEIK